VTSIVYESPDGTRETVDASDGATLMQTALAHGVDGILGECGGAAMCATCHVYVDPAQVHLLPPPTAEEQEMLACVAAERRTESRLSCQLRVRADLDGLVVRLPERQA
jgi:2Fe-2S ferredoxin